MLDTACARVALGQLATPPVVEDCQRRITHIDTEIGILERESLTGGDYRERLEELTKEKSTAESRLVELEAQWEEERRLIGALRTIRDTLEAHAASGRQGRLTRQTGSCLLRRWRASKQR